MVTASLTPTSYLVLGLVGHLGRCTSYDMKRVVAGSIGYFWSFPHSQLYAEPARLVELGLLGEEREQQGRRRRTYVLTAAGRSALDAWLAEPASDVTEIRDLGLLQLYFGGQTDAASVRRLAEANIVAHQARLDEYRRIDERARSRSVDPHHWRTLRMGLRYEETVIEFWREVALDADALAEDQAPAGGQGLPAAIGLPT